MFRATEPKLPLFETDSVFKDILPDNDWSYLYKEKVYPLINESDFQHLFTQKSGAPNKPIKLMVSILIFMGLEKLTWRNAEFQFQRRIDWLNATHTWVGDNKIDYTTLFKFYQRLEKDEAVQKLFDGLTTSFIESCGTLIKKQRTDSFFIHGWLKILSRYGLFKETIRFFLNELNKKKPGLYEEIKGKLSRDYIEKKFDLTEKDNDKAQQEIKTMASDLYLIHTTFITHKQVTHYKSYTVLSQVFDQQCEVSPANNKDETPVEVEILDKPKKTEKGIISSPHNTEVQYTRKKKQKVTGDRAFATETCDKENKTQFITDVGLTSSTTPDVKELPEIHKRLGKSGLMPETQYGDAGFVNGNTIIESSKKGVILQGPSSGRSQSFEVYNNADRPLDIADFNVDIVGQDNELVIKSCPKGQLPINQKQSSKTGNLIVHFDHEKCSTCQLKERCPVKIGKTVSSIDFNEASYVGATRHHKYMEDKEYRKECGVRAGAEGLVSELVRAHGLRKSRHRNRARTELQFKFGAIAANVKRFVNHWHNNAHLELDLVKKV